jgi:MFS family permease
VWVREFREKWPILVTAFLCMFFAFSAPGQFMPFLYSSVIEEFGWTREQATLLASAKYATGAVVAIIVGRFIDVIGVRIALIIMSTLGGIAMILFLWVDGLPLYYFGGVLFGIAAVGTIVSIKVMISRAFHASQGTAMGFALLGAALGAAVVPIVIRILIDAYGWRIATALMSTGIWVVALPILIFFYRGRSAEHEAQRVLDGEGDVAAKKAAAAVEAALGRKEVLGLMRGVPFWLIFAAVFSAAFVDQAFIQHQVLFLEVDLGMEKTFVARAVAMIGLIGIVARVGVGSMFDVLSTRGVSLSYLALGAAAVIALTAMNPMFLWLFVLFRAIAHAAVLLDTTVLAKHTFGIRNLGLLLGIFTAAVNLGFMAGPWVVARMYDATGSYMMPFIVCIGISLFAAAVLLPLRPDYWLEMRERNRQADTARASS